MKLIRDLNFDKDFIMVFNDINESNYEEYIKKEDIVNNNRIGKVKILNFEEKIHYLKIKLVEECLEVINSPNYNNLIEELGDVYCILMCLNNIVNK